MVSRRKVVEFLRAFREQTERLGGVYVTNRIKNRNALTELELTKVQREEIILSLTPEDYCEGPTPDIQGAGNVWIFGKIEEGRSIYIKLKVTHAPICLSFHPAEHPLNYPLKGGKEGWQR